MGGKQRGCFYPFGKISGASKILIGEGVATVAAAHSATGFPAVAAMGCGNLKPVAHAIKKVAPNAEVVILSDWDINPDGTNPGMNAAIKAARAIGAAIAIPELEGRKCDFWDVWLERDAETVAAAITNAKPPPAELVKSADEGSNTKPPAEESAGDQGDPIEAALKASGLAALETDATMTAVEKAVRTLASLLADVDEIRRAMVREAALKKLDAIGLSAPARLLDAALPKQRAATDEQQGRPVLFDDPEPWPDVVDGAVLLDDITTTLKRFIVLPPHAAEAVSLWILHACALKAFTISPLLVVNSPLKQSGKTLLLEVISCLLVKHLFTSNITPATLFRAVDKYTPCLLIDEADAFLRDNDELRGILNASHRKATAYVLRTVGDKHEPVLFVTWCVKAIALIGKLPDTLEDRSIQIPMKRRGPGERVNRFRSDKIDPEIETLKRKVMRWTADNLGELSKADPEAPCELNDRAMDNWRPLLAVAELAGGAWPGKSRAAAKTLSGAVDEGANSAAIQLLADLKALFSERDTDRLSSADICEALGTMEDRPWPEWKRGKPITTRQLAKLLGGFAVVPKTIRIEGETAKGYTLEQLIDPFTRYLPFSSVTTSQPVPGVGLRAISDPSQTPLVTDRKTELSPCNIKNVTDVTDRNTLFPDSEGGG